MNIISGTPVKSPSQRGLRNSPTPSHGCKEGSSCFICSFVINEAQNAVKRKQKKKLRKEKKKEKKDFEPAKKGKKHSKLVNDPIETPGKTI